MRERLYAFVRRSGHPADEARDLLVVAGLIAVARPAELEEPEKTILFVDEETLASLESRQPIEVALGTDFLAPRH